MFQTEVTNKLLENNSVSDDKIIDDSIVTRHFSNGSVTNNKLSPVDNIKYLIGNTSNTIKTYVTFNDSTGVATISANFLQTTFGNSVNYGYSSIVGAWDYDNNYFEIFPPEGKTMNNFVDIITSIRFIYWQGGVNADDAFRCDWDLRNGNTQVYDKSQADRVRVNVQNTEQRQASSANLLVFWS